MPPVPVDPAPEGSLVVAPVAGVGASAVLLCTAVPALLLPVMVALGGVPVAVTVVLPLVSGDAVGELAERSACPAVELVIAPDCAPVLALLDAVLSPAQPAAAVTNPAITASVHLFIPHLSLTYMKAALRRNPRPMRTPSIVLLPGARSVQCNRYA